MASSSQPHVASLVLESKKALSHGEKLCSRANEISSVSAQLAVDLLAVDAKVRWITVTITSQLKLAATISKSIATKRTRLAKHVQEWDAVRSAKCGALESMLDSLGSQRVPPDLYETSDDSSLFGSQHSDDRAGALVSRLSSPATVRNIPSPRDTATWKTLRDFIDDQAIEDVLENIENGRLELDDVLSKTDDFPEILASTIASIQESLPEIEALPNFETIFSLQDKTVSTMANHLESLATHYDQMTVALHDTEGGEELNEEDLQEMNRDIAELPSIIAELEEAVASVIQSRNIFQASKTRGNENLARLGNILDELDELGDIMTEMLSSQDSVKVECDERLAALQQHIFTVEHLHQRFVSYQTSFSNLILEIARRRMYQESAENIVRGMMSQLEAMSQEEQLVREHFNVEHGAHLPEDICLFIGNAPTKWEVVPCYGESLEVLPEMRSMLISEAKDRVGTKEQTPANGQESV